MKYLVLGATGGVGKELVKQAVSRGHKVTAYVRRQAEFPEGVAVKIGELSDAAALTEALAGQDAVLSGLGHHPSTMAPWGTVPEYLADFYSKTLFPAMKKQGVKRFSWVAAAGVGKTYDLVDSHLFKAILALTVLRKVFALQAKVAEAVENSGLDYQVCHPVILTDGPLSGKKAQIVPRVPFNQIPRAEVAEFMLDELEKPSFTERMPLIVHVD